MGPAGNVVEIIIKIKTIVQKPLMIKKRENMYFGSRFSGRYISRKMRIGLSTLAKEFTAATLIMQSSSNELSTLVSGKV